MASREKKLSIGGKKQNSASAASSSSSPIHSNPDTCSDDNVTNASNNASKNDEAPKLTPIKNTKLTRKIKRPITKKIIKQTISFTATKNKRGRPKKIKAILNNPNKNLDIKKVVRIKNGVKKGLVKKIKQEDDGPPILEPIFPVETEKKTSKKRIKKEEDSMSDTSEISLKSSTKGRSKKIKIDNNPTESLEDVINDLKALIESDDIKQEVVEEISTHKEDSIKKKTVPRKQKLDVPKKRTIKKENAENRSMDNSKLIDMLDLNVNKVKKVTAKRIRRHSIEKIQLEKTDQSNKVQNLNLFSNLPRSISPRVAGKRNTTKPRQGIDILLTANKRNNPYSTRSDSPARILRNGKHRKLKNLTLLDGIDSEYKRRRRLHSDYSGSEISISKLSGYESEDSSFSDLASNATNVDKECDTKIEIKTEIPDTLSNTDLQQEEQENIMDTINVPMKIKKSPSTDDTPTNGLLVIDDNFTDTNSNLFSDSKDIDTKVINPCYNPPMEESLQLKVPEKSIILDIMKHKFNESITSFDTNEETKNKTEEVSQQELDIVPTSTFYGKNVVEPEEKKEEIIETENTEGEEEEEEVKETIEEEDDKEAVEEEGEEEEEETEEDIKETIEEEQQKNIEEVEEEEDDNESSHNEEEFEQNQIEKTEPEMLQSTPETMQQISEELKQNSESDEFKGNSNELNQNSCEMSDVKTGGDGGGDDDDDDDGGDGDDDNHRQEDLTVKEHILQALGLQSLKAAEEAKQKQKEKVVLKTDNNYTGTLKTVIKLNRVEKKKGRNPVKMTLHKSKKTTATHKEHHHEDSKSGDDDVYKIMKENGSSNWKSGAQSSDTAGAPRKSHYSNRSNMDGSSEHTSDGDTNGVEEVPGKALVIPEKASSFSIHPDRLCKDECSYCFGKFGLFDTPCHIAQMKSVERQDKILANEKHLTRDSCLCDACYRHVDRKSNMPSYASKSYKRNALVAPGPKQNHCHVLNCEKTATNILRRKWIIKMKKNINDVVNIDLDNPGLHSIPICDEHYAALEHLMVCAMCKRTLAKNHIHYLGTETNDLNNILNDMGIPVKLSDKPVVCKLCRYFANILFKPPEERPENSTNFFSEYKKRLLHFHNVEPMDEAQAEEPIPVPTKDKESIKKKKKLKPQSNVENNLQYESENASDQTIVPSADSRPDSPSDYVIDYQTLIPNIALECGSDVESKKDQSKKPAATSLLKKIITTKPESVKEAVEISKSLKVKNKSDMAVQRLGSNPSISVRQLFPGEEELNLQTNIDFNNIKEKTPEGWEKCSSVIQFDTETKLLWQELQKPYGNQSSFLRHLILLEKYFRNGDLILSPNASNNSINYSESVQNRLKAYDNIPSCAGPIQPLTMLPFNKMKKSSSGIITTKDPPNVSIINTANIPKSTPITIAQISNTTVVTASSKQKSPGLPPGLISLHPGTNRPVAPLQKVTSQPTKIKFPITKNWRPNLIPIDPNKKPDKKSGLVQVISGGKAYHITVEDYKKMCAIKRTFDLRQKRLQEAIQKTSATTGTTTTTTSSMPLMSLSTIVSNPQSLLKAIVPKKGLTITKTSMAAITTTPQQTVVSSHQQKQQPEQLPLTTETSIEFDNSLEKLDKQVEKLDMKLNENKTPPMILPKIPKSLTVIPQSVRKPTNRPTTPILQITPKPKLTTTTTITNNNTSNNKS